MFVKDSYVVLHARRVLVCYEFKLQEHCSDLTCIFYNKGMNFATNHYMSKTTPFSWLFEGVHLHLDAI